jgi:hypothetical protein
MPSTAGFLKAFLMSTAVSTRGLVNLMITGHRFTFTISFPHFGVSISSSSAQARSLRIAWRISSSTRSCLSIHLVETIIWRVSSALNICETPTVTIEADQCPQNLIDVALKQPHKFLCAKVGSFKFANILTPKVLSRNILWYQWEISLEQ